MWLALMIPILSLSGIFVFFAGTGLGGAPSLLSLAVFFSAFFLVAVLVIAREETEETTEVGIDDKDGLYAATTVERALEKRS